MPPPLALTVPPSVYLDKEYYATIIIASLEGAIMMSKLHGNDNDMKRVLAHLKIQLKEI